jgi:hypothetical protein
MTSSEHLIDTWDGEHIAVRTGGTKLANPWAETAWAVLEAADDLGDEIPIEACQRVIDDDFVTGAIGCKCDFRFEQRRSR